MIFGRQIVPADEQSLLPADQYGIYTGEIYKEIGKLTNTSPRKLETLVYGYTAGLGRYASGFIDWAGAKTGALPERITLPSDPAQMPFVKGFLISDLAGTSQSIADFYDAYTRSEQAYRSLSLAVKEDNKKRIQEIRDQNIEDLAFYGPSGKDGMLYPVLGITANMLSELRKERERTLLSRTLTSDEKEENVRKINDAMTLLARRTLDATSRRAGRSGLQGMPDLPMQAVPRSYDLPLP
jgi:hypothetical protein